MKKTKNNIIKEEKFEFLNGYGKESTFLRRAYYERICTIITDFFEEELIMNDFHEYFVNFLNTLEDHDDVMFINVEMPFYWAICIIQNKRTSDHLINGKTREDLKKWNDSYYERRRIASYLLKPVNKDEYDFVKNNKQYTFLVKRYYDFINELIIVFFNSTVQNNRQHIILKSLLDMIHLDRSFEEINTIEPFQWALRVIHDKEYHPTLEDKEMARYIRFRAEFLHKERMQGFIIKKW